MARRPADTICALASGAGRAGVAVIRISGPRARDALEALTGASAPPPRRASLRRLLGPDGAAFDEALALWFPGPSSFTGEDVAELHAHGGPQVVASALAVLIAMAGVRLAEPGEFTRRAFENGKLDLAQAEGLADLIDAETEAQMRQARAQMEGALSTEAERWRAGLIAAQALLAAAIDFPDEDLPERVAQDARMAMGALAQALRARLADPSGRQLRDGLKVAIVGPPNAGKSSLFNSILGREAAIVSDIAGTTRDTLEARIAFDGAPVVLIDTAGLREATADPIEAEGMRRARAAAAAADATITLTPAHAPDPPAHEREAFDASALLALAKADLGAPDADGLAAIATAWMGPVALLSTRGEPGIGAVVDFLRERSRTAAADALAAPAITRERHRALVADALAAIEAAEIGLALGPEIAAEELRRAADALGRLTGRIDVEEVLGAVFSTFCIGK